MKVPAENETNFAEEEPPTKISKTILFRSIALLWIFPTLGACWILGTNFKSHLEANSFLDVLSSIKIEEWMALTLVLVHVLFIVLAIHYRAEKRARI